MPFWRPKSPLDGLGEEVDRNFLKYSGDDGTTTDFVLEGGDGCISVTANIAPKAMHDMIHAALNGNDQLAMELNEPLNLLHDRLFLESNPIPAKWAAYRLGLTDNAMCRAPLDTMDPQYIPLLEEALATANILAHTR